MSRLRTSAWALVAFAGGLVAIATLLPISQGAASSMPSFWCLACGDYGLADFVANVALFVPLGWALSRTGMRHHLALALVLTLTITVELLQYDVVRGRDASLSDVLANTIGGGAGMALRALRPRITKTGRRALIAATLYGVLLVAGLGVGTATQALVRPTALQWTGGALERPGYVPFTGSLTAARVNGTPAAKGEWLDVPLGDAVEAAVDLQSGRPDSSPTEVVKLWMPRGPGWIWVDQQDRDFRVHLASASDRLGLRGHSAWIRAAAPALAGEALTIRVAVRRFSYRIVVRTQGGEIVRDQRIALGDGWRLFTPFEREREPWAPLLGGMWMAGLLAPLGYVASIRSRVTMVVAATGVGACLLLLPVVSGCAPLSAIGWCGAAGGFLAGVGGRTVETHGVG